MSYTIPSRLRYDLLPSSIGEEMQKSITYPITGTNSVYSATQDFINVPKVLRGSVFDPVNSYLCFNLNMPLSESGSIQGNVSTIFQHVEVASLTSGR